MNGLQRLKKKISQLEEAGGGDYVAQGKILEEHLEAKESIRSKNQEIDSEIESFVDMIAEEEIAKDKEFLESIDEGILEENELDKIPDEALTEELLAEKKRRKEKRERFLALLTKRKAERESIIEQIMKKARDVQNSQESDINQKKQKNKDGNESQDKDKDEEQDKVKKKPKIIIKKKENDKDKKEDEKSLKHKYFSKNHHTSVNAKDVQSLGKKSALQSVLSQQKSTKSSKQNALVLASRLASVISQRSSTQAQAGMRKPIQSQQAVRSQQAVQSQQSIKAQHAIKQGKNTAVMAQQGQMETPEKTSSSTMTTAAVQAASGAPIYNATHQKDPLASGVSTYGTCPKSQGTNNFVKATRGNAMDALKIRASTATHTPGKVYNATQQKDPLASSVCTCGVCPKCLGVGTQTKARVNRNLDSILGISANSITSPSLNPSNVSMQATPFQQALFVR